MKFVCTGSFVGLLLLLSWWYGPSSFEQPLDPVEAANEERDAALKERDDAQRAWAEMGTKHERSLETILKLQNEFSKAYKDLPWLEKKTYELAEENSIQHNEIEDLKLIQRKYNELLDDVSTYGMSAKRPEFWQQKCESAHRSLEITNNFLRRSRAYVEILEAKLEAQQEKANEEMKWLRDRVNQNSRSVAYWAKVRRTTSTQARPAWGIRCACTEPEIAYALKDQTPKILELETEVAARDHTIKRLRASHWDVPKNDEASNTAHTSLSATETSPSNTVTKSQAATSTLEHAGEHEQQCKTLSIQSEEDSKTINGLRRECQDLRDAASNHPITDATEHACEHEQQCKTLSIQSEEDSKTINELRKECQDLRDAASNHTITDASEIDAKAKLEDDLAAKDAAIKDLREEKRSADEEATKKILNLRQDLSDSRRDLVDAQTKSADHEQQLGQRQTKIDELEASQRRMEDVIKQKDLEIEELEEANQEIAERPASESPETLQRLNAANTDLDRLRSHLAECREQSETQIGRISELETAGRNLETAGRDLEATARLKDEKIAGLEEQIRENERQNQTRNEAVQKKDRDYRELYDHYYLVLGQQQRADVQRNQDLQAYNTLQQNDTAKRLELQRLFIEYRNFSNTHSNCRERITNLTTQLRQDGNTHTDLQMKYNTQATELDAANQSIRELQNEVTNLQQASANLQQIHTAPASTNIPSDSDVEKYRLEGEDRARPVWQANYDREMSAQAAKLREKEAETFKLNNQLRDAKALATPLREEQLKSREDAVRAREDALKLETDAMDHDQSAPSTPAMADPEVKSLESKLEAASKEAGDAKARNRGIQAQLAKERKERKEEKERHEKELKREKEDAERRGEVLKIRLEKENPLKKLVSGLQNEVARLSRELEEQRAR